MSNRGDEPPRFELAEAVDLSRSDLRTIVAAIILGPQPWTKEGLRNQEIDAALQKAEQLIERGEDRRFPKRPPA